VIEFSQLYLQRSRGTVACVLLIALATMSCEQSSVLADSKTARALDDKADSAKSVKAKFTSGRSAGQLVPSFFVRAVTGPLRNKSVCYVCRNGNRPVIMFLTRRLTPKLAELLKATDELVDKNRAAGLRAFGVLIDDEPAKSVSKLQTLAFDEKLSIPLTASTKVVCAPVCQNVHEQAELTVVLYKKRRVVKTFAFRRSELDSKDIRRIIAESRRLISLDEEKESSTNKRSTE